MDLPDLPGCPCGRFELDPGAVSWRDVAACRHLILAALLPNAYELLLALMATRDSRKKWRLQRRSCEALRLHRRDMLP